MKKIAVLANWVLLVLFVVTLMVMLVRYPARSGIGNFVLMLPYATALLALNTRPRRVLAGFGMFFNAVCFAFGIVGFVAVVVGQMGEPLAAAVGFTVISVPSALNFLLLKRTWDQALAIARDAAQASRELAIRSDISEPEAR